LAAAADVRGLFIVVAGFEQRSFSRHDPACERLDLDHARPVAGDAALSNLVSNVPAVLVLKPLVAASANPQHTWLIVPWLHAGGQFHAGWIGG